MREQRQAALEQVIHELERRFGPGIVYRLSQARPKVGAIALSTGSLGLDHATGIGGVPRGRITELVGPPSCGKTTLAYHILANAQDDGGMAAFIDAAQAMDGEAMLASGVNLDDLLIAVPLSVVEALEIAEILARCRALDAVVLAALTSLCAAAGPGRYMPEALRKVNAAIKGSPTAMVLVNEGPAIKKSSLAPLPFYASLRVALSPLCALRGPGGDVVGLRAQSIVIKNKLARPGGTAEFIIREGSGIYREAELLDLALRHSLIETLPLGLVYQGGLLGKSRGQALAHLAHAPEVAARLASDLREYLKLAG